MTIKPRKKKFGARLVNFLFKPFVVFFLLAWFTLFAGMEEMSTVLEAALKQDIDIGWLPLLVSVYFAYPFLFAEIEENKKIYSRVFRILLALQLILPLSVYLAFTFMKVDTTIIKYIQVVYPFSFSGFCFKLCTRRDLLKSAVEENQTMPTSDSVAQ